MTRESNTIGEFILDEVRKLKLSLMEIHDYYLCYIRWRKETRDELSRLIPEDRNVPIRLLELLYSTTPGPQQWYREFVEIEKIGNDLCRQNLTVYEDEPESDSETEIDDDEYSNDETNSFANGTGTVERIYEYY